MFEKIEIDDQTSVDKGLVAMFLRMSPEERLRANDDAFRTMLELRDAYLKTLIEVKISLPQSGRHQVTPSKGVSKKYTTRIRMKS